MKLEQLALFVKIVEKGGLAAAGREMALSPTTVSERLAGLEKHYGVTLINRTTRVLRLTEEGRTLLDGARQIIDRADELDSHIRFGADALSGLIRVSTPIDLGHTKIKPIADAFLAEHTKTSIELVLSDSYLNIVEDGIDIALRFGEPADSTLRVRRLAKNPRIVCASPAYLRAHGHPAVPSDLEQHNCLVMRFGSHLDNAWKFVVDGNEEVINVTGNRIANNGRLAHEWSLAGHGILLKSIWDVGEELASGALVSLLQAYAPSPTHVQMLFPPSRNPPRRVTKFADWLADAFVDEGSGRMLS